MAIVNGDTIAVDHLVKLLGETHQHQSDEQRSSFDYRRLLDKLVNDRIIIQDALALGMEEELEGELEEYRHNAARKLYIKERFQPDLEVSQEEMMEVFREMYWRMQIRTVSIGTLAEAEQLIEDIRQGASMDSIARAVSYDSRRFKGGLHKKKLWADIINEFRDQAVDLPVGAISNPFPLRDVYTFLRIEERSVADTAEFQMLSGRIRRDLQYEKRDEAWLRFLDSLSRAYPLQVDSTALNAIRSDSPNLFTPAFMQGTATPVFSFDDELLVTDNDLRQEISYNAMQSASDTFETHFQASCEKLTQGVLLLCAARNDGYMTAPTVDAGWLELLHSGLINIYLQEMIASRIVFSHAEFEEYYNEHLEDFHESDELKLEELHVHTEEQVEVVRSRLEGGADFGFVEKLFGAPEEAKLATGEWASLDIFPDVVAEKLTPLGQGEYCGPFQIEGGWYFLSVKDRRPGRLKTLAEVDPRIREVMFQLKFNDLLENHLQILKDNSQIIYFEDKIEELLGSE